MENFLDYSVQFSDLPIEIIIFFSETQPLNGRKKPRSLFDFLTDYSKKKNLSYMPQPNVISKICDILVENNILNCVSRSGFNGINNTYIALTDEIIKQDINYKNMQNLKLNCMIYGFPYIYRNYQEFIKPLMNVTSKGDKRIGTAFLLGNGIVTAKHNLEGAEKISIEGISKDFLNNAKILIYKNKYMDIAYIKKNDVKLSGIPFIGEGKILNDVLVMGYPRVSGFQNFLTVEKAQISSIRLTGTTGQIVASSEMMWVREKLLLITAKIKGGNSGGPVIAKTGEVIGITCGIPDPNSEGDYDDLGYGAALPASFILGLLEENESTIEFTKGNLIFEDFSE